MKVNWLAINLALLATLAVVLGGCTIPLPLPMGIVPQPNVSGQSTAPAAVSEPAATENGAMATVATRSLRVRQSPAENSEVVAGIGEGETYRVLALSNDGLWVQLAIDSAPSGNGWVSANFVSVEGDITDLAGRDATVAEAGGTVPTVTLVPTPQSGFGVVNTNGVRLRVRSGPNADTPIVGYVYDGESYQILETSADGTWVRIPASSGDNGDNAEGGWVAAAFVTVGQ